MTSVRTLQDLIANLPEATFADGVKNIVASESGQLLTANISMPTFSELYKAEANGTVLPLAEFVDKYIARKPVGHFLTNSKHDYSNNWSVGLNEDLSLSTQDTTFIVLKAAGSPGAAWTRFVIMAVHPSSIFIFTVMSYSTPDKEIKIFRVPLSII